MTDKALSLHNDYCLKLIRERKQGASSIIFIPKLQRPLLQMLLW